MVNVEEIIFTQESALIAEFPPDMEISDEMFARVNERFEELAARPDIDTHISVLQMDDPLDSTVFERAQDAARAGAKHGITTWITVSDGIKKMALKSQVEEIEGVETLTADGKSEAIEIATE